MLIRTAKVIKVIIVVRTSIFAWDDPLGRVGKPG